MNEEYTLYIKERFSAAIGIFDLFIFNNLIFGFVIEVFGLIIVTKYKYIV